MTLGNDAADDDLLRPTVRQPRTTGSPPWRLASLGFLTFFGGAVAGTVMVLLNAGRLGATPRQRWLIVGIGVLALAITVPLVIVLYDGESRSTYRFAAKVVAMLGYLAQARVLGPLDRAFQLRDGTYASLWLPGFAAVIGLGVVEAVALAVLAGTVG